MVVEPNPVSQHSSGMLHCLKPLPVNTLLLGRSNDPLHQSVWLRAMRRDEFLLQTIASYQPGLAAAGEDQPVVTSQKKRSSHPAQGSVPVDQSLLQGRLCSYGLGRSRQMPAQNLSGIAVNHNGQACPAVQEALGQTLDKAKRLVMQTASRKAVDNRAKLYSWHAPEVECISKGKSRNAYEFGVKVGLAMTLKGNLIVVARNFPGNPYDCHTMHEQIEQSAILMQGLGVKPSVLYADLGYRGVDKDNPDIEIKHRSKDKRLRNEERRLLKRRQAIEPIIGHLKADHRMDRCHLKWSEGDAFTWCYARRATTSAGCCG
jgi:hypothetical protein